MSNLSNEESYILIMQRKQDWYITKKKYTVDETEEIWKKYARDYPDYMADWGSRDINEVIEFVDREWGLSDTEKEIFLNFAGDKKVERLILTSQGWRFDMA